MKIQISLVRNISLVINKTKKVFNLLGFTLPFHDYLTIDQDDSMMADLKHSCKYSKVSNKHAAKYVSFEFFILININDSKTRQRQLKSYEGAHSYLVLPENYF